jgi:hypothetical protein
VVALVERNACSSAEQKSLFLGLVLLSSGEKATGRYANIEERPVVGTTVERGCSEICSGS